MQILSEDLGSRALHPPTGLMASKPSLNQRRGLGWEKDRPKIIPSKVGTFLLFPILTQDLVHANHETAPESLIAPRSVGLEYVMLNCNACTEKKKSP